MMKAIRGLIYGLLVAVSMPASAGVLYSNNFDAENGGVGQSNYSSLNGLTLENGSVDLLKSGDSGITCPSGLCINLHGSTETIGSLLSSFYQFSAGDTVTLSFTIGGNQRSGYDTYGASLIFSSPVDLLSYGSTFGPFSPGGPAFNSTRINSGGQEITFDAPFSQQSLFFTAITGGSVRLRLVVGVGDNPGPIIDNLSLTSSGTVPEPATWAMMIVGLGVVGGTLRRRTVSSTFGARKRQAAQALR